MQRVRTLSVSVVLLSFVLSGCCTVRGPSPRAIRGRVVNPSNAPVANVEVRVPGRRPLRTDANGAFVIPNPPTADRLAVSFRASGFIDTTRIWRAQDQATTVIDVMIWPRALPQTLNAGRGGSLVFAAGRLTIPPRALIDGRGRVIDGDVRVSFSAFDVTDPSQYRSAPGDFTARMRDGSIRQLETFGVFEVYVEDAKRAPINLGPGATAGVRLLVPERLRRTVPAAVGSFTFEAATGLWIEQVSLFQLAQPQELVGTLNTLGAWNADQVLNTTCIRITAACGCPEAADPTFYVSGQGVDYAHSFSTQNDPCVNVKRNATVLLTPADSAFQPAQITTPTTVAKCNTSGGCTDVKFHCPTQAMLDDPLNTIQEPPWWRAFGFPTADPAFDTTWKQSQVNVDGLGSLTLQLDPCTTGCFGEGYQSGQYQTTCYYGYGTYEATFRAAEGPGLVTSFFVFTNEPRHDEIDFEIFGRPATDVGCLSTQTALQTNYFVNGDGLMHEQITCLDYNAFTTSKLYRFVWSADGIEWFADKNNDGTLDSIRKLSLSNGDPGPFPTQPGKIFVNLWAVDNQNAGATNTFGTFNYSTTPQPIKAWYDRITYTP